MNDTLFLSTAECLKRPIVITRPDLFEGETKLILSLVLNCAALVHIRKPNIPQCDLEHLLQSLATAGCPMNRLTLHYNADLALKYGIGGVHLKITQMSDYCAAKKVFGAPLRLSFSAHTWAEVEQYHAQVDYLFLSPIFDSVSKAGYTSHFKAEEVQCNLSRIGASNAVALGGVTADSVHEAIGMGFAGVAVLGAVWANESPQIAYNIIARKILVKKGLLQFISDGDLGVVEAYLRGGGRWVQLRMKVTPSADIVDCGLRLRDLCRTFGAVLIINDQPAVAKTIGADGVHLGRGDMPVVEARCLLGSGMLIGSTANTLSDVLDVSVHDIDYIGLGPFRFTNTKKNLSPVLGHAGYYEVMNRMRAEDIGPPVVAIGGIEAEDVVSIMQCGVDGIAVSGALSRAADVMQCTERFLRELHNV